MTPGLLRPLARPFDQQTGKSTREYENTKHHFHGSTKNILHLPNNNSRMLLHSTEARKEKKESP